jgi:hypothetical protein
MQEEDTITAEPIPTSSSSSASNNKKEKRSRKEQDQHDHDDDDSSTDDNKRFRSYQTGQWQTKYETLVKFRNQTGHCLVPHSYQGNPSLAHWVKRQRYQYKLMQQQQENNNKTSTMTLERLGALEDIGFVWDSQAATWYERFYALQRFCDDHNHCNVPSNNVDTQLATWVKCQRRQYKLLNKDMPSNMTVGRVKDLEALGFEWEVRNYKTST